MKVIGFSGFSGSGKTTLIEKLIGHMRAAGNRVSVVKHAHHEFDVDRKGKDSYRHRKAGAFEIVVASHQRLALIREYEASTEPTVYQLLAELSECDWALVEGFKHAGLPKIEIWRAETGEPVRYPDDPNVVAIATDTPDQLPVPTTLPLIDLNNPQAVADFLLANASRYDYQPPPGVKPVATDADAGRGARAPAGRHRDAAGD
jgi:molybdopterin-guanine dinucleotide biosynthesis adapter protein